MTQKTLTKPFNELTPQELERRKNFDCGEQSLNIIRILKQGLLLKLVMGTMRMRCDEQAINTRRPRNFIFHRA